MREEFLKLYNEYVAELTKQDAEYFKFLAEMKATHLYKDLDKFKPTFEGFIKFLSTPISNE